MEKMMEGKIIAITRSKEDSEEFVHLITNVKARAISLPTIELVSKGEGMIDEFLTAIKEDDPDFSVFMSSKAVKILFDTARKISKYEKLQLAVANNKVDAIVFTSASSVRAFFDIMQADIDKQTLNKILKKCTLVAIGPFTADELTKFGLQSIIANIHTVPGAVETIKSYFS